MIEEEEEEEEEEEVCKSNQKTAWSISRDLGVTLMVKRYQRPFVQKSTKIKQQNEVY